MSKYHYATNKTIGKRQIRNSQVYSTSPKYQGSLLTRSKSFEIENLNNKFCMGILALATIPTRGNPSKILILPRG